jgi:hypothetical protein
MPTGLKIPMGVNSGGGLATVDGDDNDAKIIKLTLSDGENENAFQQDITLGIDMIFDILDPIVRSKITIRIVRAFEKLQSQKRFKLLKNTINWDESSSAQGELTLNFRYLNLESDEEKEYEQKFNSGA